MVSIVDLFRHFTPRPAIGKWNDETRGCPKRDASSSGVNAPDRVREISVRELARLKECPLFIDVREKNEYLCGHIEGAQNLSRAVLKQVVPEILPDRTKPIVVYCARGSSSAEAAKMLQNLGYQNVYSLKAGLLGWLEAGAVLHTSTI